METGKSAKEKDRKVADGEKTRIEPRVASKGGVSRPEDFGGRGRGGDRETSVFRRLCSACLSHAVLPGISPVIFNP